MSVKLWDAFPVTSGQTYKSKPIPVPAGYSVSITAVFSGSVAGTPTIECSNALTWEADIGNPDDWQTYTGVTLTPVSGAGTAGAGLVDYEYEYARFSFACTGTGTVTLRVSTKQRVLSS